MFKRLAHVCIKTNDLDACERFYRDVLGCRVVFHFHRNDRVFGAYFEVGSNSFIEVFENSSAVAMQSTGLDHFCLETGDIDAVITHLEEQGVEHTQKKRGADQSWQIWIKDPDGHRIEIQEYTEASSQHTGRDAIATW